jgi:HK97 family phage major capsid protein
MKTSVELRQLQSLKRAEGSELVDKAETEKRELSVEETTILRNIQSEVEAFENQIKDAELREKFAKTSVQNKKSNDGLTAEERELGSFSMTKFFNSINRNEPITGFEREVLDEGVTEARSLGASSNGHYINLKALNAIQKRAMSAGSSSAGGNFVQTDKMGFFDVLRANRVLDKVGAEWEMGMVPNVDYTGFSTGWTFADAAENATAADADAVTVNRSISPKRIAGKILLSNQLMIQDPTMDAKLLQSLQNALYPYVEGKVLTGNGSSNAMTGITSNATAATLALGTNGGAPSLTYIQNVRKTLLNGNVDASKIFWIINPNTEALLMATPIDTGSGAMLIPYGSYFNGVNGFINGIPYLVTSNLPNNLTKGTASGTCSAVIAGDFSNLKVCQWGGLDIVIDPYTAAAEGQTRIICNTYWDTTIKRSGTILKTLDLITG